MAFTLRTALMVLMLAGWATPGSASFLRSTPPAGGHASASHMQVTTEEVRQALLQEIQAEFGDSRHATSSKIEEHEAALRPMFASLAKNEEGLLGHTVVRYALHRYFAQRHGWSVKGLDPAGGAWNSSSSILQDLVPRYVQELFEQRLHGRGLSLHDLAVLAATLEHIIHGDVGSRLEAAYRALGLSVEGGNREDQVVDAIETFMMVFVLGQDILALSPAEVQAERASIVSVYPSWPDTRNFVREVYRNATGSSLHADGPHASDVIEFAKARAAMEAVQDHYGPWQDRECREMKRVLLRMEEGETGRVPLTDFYGQSEQQGWQFSEDIDFLRQLGALDESVAARPRVIVPNYVNSASNCLASTGFYAVCCINECEGILAGIEEKVAYPTAPAPALATIVASISSSTVPAPRTLPAQLLERLDQIAAHHGGQVPLHGRLFSQWLHHAFPRECPYPHIAGSTSPMTASEWTAETNQTATVTLDLRQQAAANKTAVEVTAGSMPLPWEAVEELVHPVHPTRSGRAGFFRTLAQLAAVVSLIALARGLAQQGTNVQSKKHGSGLLLPYATKSHVA